MIIINVDDDDNNNNNNKNIINNNIIIIIMVIIPVQFVVSIGITVYSSNVFSPPGRPSLVASIIWNE